MVSAEGAVVRTPLSLCGRLAMVGDMGGSPNEGRRSGTAASGRVLLEVLVLARLETLDGGALLPWFSGAEDCKTYRVSSPSHSLPKQFVMGIYVNSSNLIKYCCRRDIRCMNDSCEMVHTRLMRQIFIIVRNSDLQH